MKRDLLTEAMADLKILKKTQEELVRQQILEEFEPTIKRLVGRKLDEENGIDDEEETGEGEFEENPLDQDSGFESFEDEPMEDEGSEFDMEESMEGEDDPELAELMRELEGEDEMMDEGEDEGWEDDTMDEGEDMDDDDFMSEGWDSDEEMVDESEEYEDDPVEEMRQLQTENAKLKRDLRKSHLTVATLKKTINEVNLVNAKLLYNTKIGRQYDLDRKQKTAVLEALDRGNTGREVKLIYATICESLNKTTSLKRKKPVTESRKPASKFIKPKQTLQENNKVLHFQRLAGIIKED